jgi:hypothetical protein
MNRARFDEPFGNFALGPRDLDALLQTLAQIRLDQIRSQIDQEDLPKPSVKVLRHPGIGQMRLPCPDGRFRKCLQEVLRPLRKCELFTFAQQWHILHPFPFVQQFTTYFGVFL